MRRLICFYLREKSAFVCVKKFQWQITSRYRIDKSKAITGNLFPADEADFSRRKAQICGRKLDLLERRMQIQNSELKHL